MFVKWRMDRGVNLEVKCCVYTTKTRTPKKIRQYEYENFIYLYEAYTALKGNSFIEKIYKEVKEWDVET